MIRRKSGNKLEDRIRIKCIHKSVLASIEDNKSGG